MSVVEATLSSANQVIIALPESLIVMLGLLAGKPDGLSILLFEVIDAVAGSYAAYQTTKLLSRVSTPN